VGWGGVRPGAAGGDRVRPADGVVLERHPYVGNMAKWKRPNALEALTWFASQRRMTVFADVPVTNANWRGWGSGCSRRVIDVAVPALSDGQVRPFAEDDFVVALASGRPIHPLNAWGFADRTVLGHLATHQAYLARTWRPSGPVQPVALVAPGLRGSNVASAYYATGYAIEAIPGEAPPKGDRGGSAGGLNDPWWAPKTPEDRLLHDLWERRGRKGWWLAEVPVGFKIRTSEAVARRLDAVVVDQPDRRQSKGADDLVEFGEIVAAGAAAELVEAKPALNSDALGQLLCGAHMFAESWPGGGPLSLTACVGRDGDEADRWFCFGRGIRVEVVSAL